MKRIRMAFLKEIVFGIILVWGIAALINHMRKPELDTSSLPELSVKLIDGTNYQLSKGKPVVIHFWATWCPVCKIETANIARLSKYYDVLTIAVNSGDTPKLRRYMQGKGLTFRVLNDTDGIWAKRFKIEAFPTTFIYDSNGRLKFTEVGYTTTAGLMARVALASYQHTN